MMMVGTAEVSRCQKSKCLLEDRVVIRVVINLVGLEADPGIFGRQGLQVGFGFGAMRAAIPPEQVDRHRVDGGF